MKKTYALVGVMTIVMGGLAMLLGVVQAYRGDPAVKGPNYTVERHEEMEKAFETKNYDAWKNLMSGRGRVTQVITKENFSRFAEAHRLAEEGKITEANAIRKELGLGMGQGKGNGMRWQNK